MSRSRYGYPLTLSELHAEDVCREEIRKARKAKREQTLRNR